MRRTPVNDILRALQKSLGPGTHPLHAPQFNGNEWKYVKDCIDTTFVSSVGAYVDRFEQDIAAFTGAKHAVAVVNGTAALHIALQLSGVEAKDEVLVPALTFIATANAVCYCGAVPHFVDSSPITLGVDPEALRKHLDTTTERTSGRTRNRETGRRISALVVMHTFGHPVELEPLIAIAHDYNLVLIEDAAESLGSYYQGRHTGTFGRFGTLSFNGNKTITTGGGGAILTNDAVLAKQAKHITTTAKIPHAWDFVHDQVGYNYRMPNINAALGCAQLEQLPAMLEAKRRLYERYHAALKGIEGIKVMAEPEGSRSNYWLQTLILNEEEYANRDELLKATNAAGIMTRPIWQLMHRLKPFVDCPTAKLSEAESLEKRVINMPSSASLGWSN